MAAKSASPEDLVRTAERIRRLCGYYLKNPTDQSLQKKLEPTLRHFISLQEKPQLAERLAVAAWQVLRDGTEPGMIQKVIRHVEAVYAQHGMKWKADRSQVARALKAEVVAYRARQKQGKGRPVKPETRAARVLRILQGRDEASAGRRGTRPDEGVLLADALALVDETMPRNM
jgi:hypothetical protein